MPSTLQEIQVKKIHIIINPGSGKMEPVLPVFNEVFKDSGIEWDVSVTKKNGDACELARKFAKTKIDALGVYGGDGTVAEAIRGIVGTDIPIFIFPGGTANVLATELEIPKDLKEACKILTDGNYGIRKLDLGQSGKNIFILRASFGFGSE